MMTDADTIADIPEGFERNLRKSPLTEPWEPLYAKRTDKAVIIGLRLARPHTNGRGRIHGGLIAALSDNAMGHSCGHAMGGASSLVTIGLAVDFVGSAEVGQWLALESEVIRTGKTICFAQCLIKADGVVIARANATFRVVPKTAQVA
ncbi:MAG: PaaI family thioesterase [bacterium]|nr:PaaI family thioesterase [bacterium]